MTSPLPGATRGGRVDAGLDESVSTVVDPLGEEIRELFSLAQFASAVITFSSAQRAFEKVWRIKFMPIAAP